MIGEEQPHTEPDPAHPGRLGATGGSGRARSAEEVQLRRVLAELAEAGVPAGAVDLWPAIRSRRQPPQARSRPRWTGVAGFGQPHSSARALAIVLVAGVLVLAAAGTTGAVSQLLRAFDPGRSYEGPEEAAQVMSQVVDPPLTLPSDSTTFYQIEPHQAAAETGSAVAHLSPPPAMGEQVDVGLPSAGPWSPEQGGMAVAVRSVVRYRGDSHTVLVTLDEPSSAMAAKQLLVGEKALSLADGRQVWASVRPNDPLPTLIAMLWDPYIVAIATDLSLDAALPLAERVDVIPATRTGSGPSGSTGSERAWPTAAPAAVERHPAVALNGSAKLVRGDGQSQLAYSLEIGNPGTRPVDDVAVLVELPAALQGPAGRSTIPVSLDPPTLAPGDLQGVSAEVPLRLAAGNETVVAQALTDGVVVRVSWREGGQRRERAFLIHPDD